MERLTVIETARRAAGISQVELSWRAQTAQSAISDYERRRKSPTMAVVERLLAAADADLMVVPTVAFERQEAPGDPGFGVFWVPDRLWPLLPPLCFDRARIGDVVWDLSVRAERIRAYELVLCHGSNDAILECVDGALLVDVWAELELPVPVREAWQPLIDQVHSRRGAPIRNLVDEEGSD